VGLPSGKTLVFGGWDTVGNTSEDVDQYDPVINQAPSATRNVGNYPRMHLLPDGRIVKTGTSSMSVWFDTVRNTWSGNASMTSGDRKFGLSMLMPGCEQVVALGGKASKNGPAKVTVEILDATAAAPRWRTTTSMNSARLNANGVLLPDGQLLVVGGNASGTETGPVKSPELFNPTTETWTTRAPHQVNRTYHSTALLLPDGRVFVGGGEIRKRRRRTRPRSSPRPTSSKAPGQRSALPRPPSATAKR